ncbi:MAG: hypothetical protein ACLUHE_05460 [Christensenellales bacterium]
MVRWLLGVKNRAFPAEIDRSIPAGDIGWRSRGGLRHRHTSRRWRFGNDLLPHVRRRRLLIGRRKLCAIWRRRRFGVVRERRRRSLPRNRLRLGAAGV